MNFRGVLAKDYLFLTHPVVSIIIHIFACAQVPTRSLPVHIKHPGHRCSGYQYNEEELGSLQLSIREENRRKYFKLSDHYEINIIPVSKTPLLFQHYYLKVVKK